MYEVAVGLFSQALLSDPMNGTYNQSVHFNRACANHKLGRFDEALLDCDKAIALNA
jgi:tetratricopeptide (TPR) repeat protein